MSRLSHALERVADAVERWTALDAPADAAQKVTGLLPPGAVKDLLSGTPIGHPVHPLLVTLPIGAFSWASVLDLTGNDQAARRLIGLGILSALPTAVTGASDWGDTAGAERRVGVLHAALNTVALGAFAVSWVARRKPGRGRGSALAGLTLIGASGWLGGHLSYAMGVGVDVTAFQSSPTDWTDACQAADLVAGPHVADVDGVPVLLVRRNDGSNGIDAVYNRCSHRGGPLDEGPLTPGPGDDGCVECPWHGSRFRLSDGLVERGPATRPQPTLDARVVDGTVQVRRSEPRSLRTNPV